MIFVTVLSLKYTFPESASIVISPAESKNILAVDDSIVVPILVPPKNNLLPVLIYAISLTVPLVCSPCIFVSFAIIIVPSISTTSKLVVPSTSKSPLKSTLPDALKVLASISPLALMAPEAVTGASKVILVPSILVFAEVSANLMVSEAAWKSPSVCPLVLYWSPNISPLALILPDAVIWQIN